MGFNTIKTIRNCSELRMILQFCGLNSKLFIVSTIFAVSFLSSIGGKPPLSTERYDKFIDFWSINDHFRFETILSQEFARGCDNRLAMFWLQGTVTETVN